ncbi:DNA-directed RNA polymerase subunit beta [Natribacillus halophilus]|uniref:DNA-directed RNA polymerase subunit beta n=1 Tax=Natribacillus halophilus TaxID=549003 RepID=A0A1G8KSH7_9BACI|nr:DNA-directed RNA polymerase subunit beta [Natribacillus halophilus]SDI46394.1 DNA-directed RNA polymerase subunit beta [Natribacillus halophilus]
MNQKEYRTRLIPMWMRLLIVLFLLIVSMTSGLVIGYSVIGEGEGLQILHWDTWQQLYQYISGG